MAREHRADHRPLHQGRLLTAYRLAIIDDGPWPGRLAFGPAPLGPQDPAAIAAWGAVTVLGLTTPDEAESQGWPALADRFASAGIPWINLPIDDFAIPDARATQAWPAIRAGLLAHLTAGRRVLVHCRGGRGRSGMIAAALLAAGGLSAVAAVAAVRRVQPDAIETAQQMDWLFRQIPLR